MYVRIGAGKLHIYCTRSSMEAEFWPLYPFWKKLVPEHSPGHSSQVVAARSFLVSGFDTRWVPTVCFSFFLQFTCTSVILLHAPKLSYLNLIRLSADVGKPTKQTFYSQGDPGHAAPGDAKHNKEALFWSYTACQMHRLYGCKISECCWQRRKVTSQEGPKRLSWTVARKRWRTL